ncbi:hypothetical protein CB1_001437025 [Camelus ferus]|nr:hypothetical protein CB1_001437025 [Camelus ferus]
MEASPPTYQLCSILCPRRGADAPGKELFPGKDGYRDSAGLRPCPTPGSVCKPPGPAFADSASQLRQQRVRRWGGNGHGLVLAALTGRPLFQVTDTSREVLSFDPPINPWGDRTGVAGPAYGLRKVQESLPLRLQDRTPWLSEAPLSPAVSSAFERRDVILPEDFLRSHGPDDIVTLGLNLPPAGPCRRPYPEAEDRAPGTLSDIPPLGFSWTVHTTDR